MSSLFSKHSKFGENLENGGKIETMFSVFYIIAFDTVLADCKYNKENTCDRQSIF